MVNQRPNGLQLTIPRSSWNASTQRLPFSLVPRAQHQTIKKWSWSTSTPPRITKWRHLMRHPNLNLHFSLKSWWEVVHTNMKISKANSTNVEDTETCATFPRFSQHWKTIFFYIGKATVHVTSLWWNIEFEQSNNCFSGRVLTNLNQNCEDRYDALSLLSLVVFHHPRAPWHGKWSTPFHQHLLSSHTGTHGTTHANDMQRKAVGRHPWTIKSSESAVP